MDNAFVIGTLNECIHQALNKPSGCFQNVIFNELRKNETKM